MSSFEERARERVESLGDDLDLDTFAAAFNLFRLSTRVIQDLEASVHRPRGLSIAGFRVLFTIWTLGAMEPRELARLSGVSRAAISGTVATLETAGLVEKSREQADRRLITVRLTGDGTALLESAYRAQNERERELFANVSRDELRALTATMSTLLDDRGPDD